MLCLLYFVPRNPILKRPVLIRPPVPHAYLVWILLLLSVAALFHLWLLIALRLQQPSGWMALVSALAITPILRLGPLLVGWLRITVGISLTVLLSAAVYWCLAAIWMGQVLGVPLWESVFRLRPYLAWVLLTLNVSWMEGFWLILAVILEVILDFDILPRLKSGDS